MLKIEKNRFAGSAQLRVALAIVFFLVSSLQGTLFASAGSFGQMNANSAAHHQMVADDAAGVHQHGQMADTTATDQAQHGDKTILDKGCEVHCAPASAVPVDHVDIAQAVARCFALSIAAILVDGNYGESIRPPRHLI